MAALIDTGSDYPQGFRGPIVRKYTLKTTRSAPSSSRLDYEGDLNDQQREVVLAGAGPMLVIAGAGTGKTHTLTYRVAHLIEQGVKPEHILLLTFTNKAARAMTDRVSSLLGDEVKGVWSGTFHSIANRILRHSGQKLGYPKDFSILDTEDSNTLMRTCVADADVDRDKRLPQPKVLVRIHSMCINTQRALEEVIEEFYPYFLDQTEDLRMILRLYQARKMEMALMDFDDLLWNWRRLLIEHEDERIYWSKKFEHILVDEYQDTNHLQGEVVDLMAAYHKNVMVVGDDCQSIYAFRGADYLNILEFPERYERCRQYRLELNYRSTPEILDLANRSIVFNKRQFHKTLQAERPSGPKPALIALKDVYQQAEFVCQRILDLQDEGVPLDEIAVLYRSHYHSMELQVEMTKRNIPYVVRSGMRFFEQAHIKDVLAYLRFIYNPRDEISFMRLAHHWQHIGTKRAQDIWDYITSQTDPIGAISDTGLTRLLPSRAGGSWSKAAKVFSQLRKQRLTQSPSTMIETILAGGYKDVVQRSFDNADNRLGDLEQLANYAAQYEDLDRFLGEISLLTTLNGQDIVVGHQGGKEEQVCLTSIHQAKGLEWSAVFALWLADGHFPSQLSLHDQEQIEEERRLFYVAATRARDDLYLCHPYTQLERGKGIVLLRPSMFICELEQPGSMQAPPNQELEPFERWAIDVV